MKVNIGRYLKNNSPRKIKVEIQPFDIWNLDHTLALIIHPALLVMKEDKTGVPFVQSEDVPQNLRNVIFDDPAYVPYFDETKQEEAEEYMKYLTDRWSYVLEEMIFAFGSIIADDFDTNAEIDARVRNGLKLFGIYFQALWT